MAVLHFFLVNSTLIYILFSLTIYLLFVQYKTITNKRFAGLMKKMFAHFQNFYKNQKRWDTIYFKFLAYTKLPQGHVRSSKVYIYIQINCLLIFQGLLFQITENLNQKQKENREHSYYFVKGCEDGYCFYIRLSTRTHRA